MRVVRDPDPMCLAEILEDDVELVEVLDAVPSSVERFAERVISGHRLGSPMQRVCAVEEEADDDTGMTRELGQLATVEGSSEFSAWARYWIDGFAALNDVREVGLRLCHLHAPMCPRFHVDQVPSRLIVTLAGTGTQWLPDRAVDRDDRSAMDLRPGSIGTQQLAERSVGLFKGSGFDDGCAPGVVHRSPPGREQRLVMTLDAIL